MAGNLEFINSFTSGSVTSFSIDNIFSNDYDVYYITGNTGNTDFTNDGIDLRLLDNTGTVISGSEYDFARLNVYAHLSFIETGITSSTYFITALMYMKDNPSAIGAGFSMYIFNPYNTSYTFLTMQNVGFDGGAGDGMFGQKSIGVHKVAETIRGINLSSTETMNAVEISVYGVK
jgi:hypothetical protein